MCKLKYIWTLDGAEEGGGGGFRFKKYELIMVPTCRGGRVRNGPENNYSEGDWRVNFLPQIYFKTKGYFYNISQQF